MKELALFAGAGGGILGSLLLGHEIVAAVEFNPYRQEVLRQRQRDGMLPPFPIFDDVRTFDCAPWRGKIDLVSGGFPCQPFSTAGSRKGEDDERNMWPDTARIIREVGPPFLFLENVPALLADQYFGRILGDLAESGYDALWDCVPASAVGAPHQRDRLWIFAIRRGLSDTDRELLRLIRERVREQRGEPWASEPGDDGADADADRVGPHREADDTRGRQPDPGRVRARNSGEGRDAPPGCWATSNPDRFDAYHPGSLPGAVGGERSEEAGVLGSDADAGGARSQGRRRMGRSDKGRSAPPPIGCDPSGCGTHGGGWWTPESRPPSLADGVAAPLECDRLLRRKYFDDWYNKATEALKILLGGAQGGAEAPGQAVHQMWINEAPQYPPQGPQPGEQCAEQPGDPVREMPRGGASEGGGLGPRTGCGGGVRRLRGDVPAEAGEAGNPVRREGMRGGMGEEGSRQEVEPFVRPPFVAHGVENRIQRLEATGDGQVPLVAAYAFVRLAQAALEVGLGETEGVPAICPTCCAPVIDAGLARPGRICQACEFNALGDTGVNKC